MHKEDVFRDTLTYPAESSGILGNLRFKITTKQDLSIDVP